MLFLLFLWGSTCCNHHCRKSINEHSQKLNSICDRQLSATNLQHPTAYYLLPTVYWQLLTADIFLRVC